MSHAGRVVVGMAAHRVITLKISEEARFVE
jgi:hypothetical protein